MSFFRKSKNRDAIRQPQFYDISGFNFEEDAFKFKSMDASVLNTIKEQLQRLKITDRIEDIHKNTLSTNCERFTELDEVLKCVLHIWQSDYNDSTAKSSEDGWDFYYFFSKNNKTDYFLIGANLYNRPNEFNGNVLYDLVTIKIDRKSYLVWDMTN